MIKDRGKTNEMMDAARAMEDYGKRSHLAIDYMAPTQIPPNAIPMLPIALSSSSVEEQCGSYAIHRSTESIRANIRHMYKLYSTVMLK